MVPSARRWRLTRGFIRIIIDANMRHAERLSSTFSVRTVKSISSFRNEFAHPREQRRTKEATSHRRPSSCREVSTARGLRRCFSVSQQRREDAEGFVSRNTLRHFKTGGTPKVELFVHEVDSADDRLTLRHFPPQRQQRICINPQRLHRHEIGRVGRRIAS